LTLVQRARRALLAPRGEGPQTSDAALRPIAFIKLHKTGGSTMGNIINRIVLHRNLEKIFPNDRGVINWLLLKATVQPKHQFDVICNHHTFNEEAVRAYLKPNPLLFSILREPMAMIDSRFRWKTTKNNFDLPTWASRLGLMEADKATWTNPMARDLGWYDGIDIRRTNPEGEAAYRNDKDKKAIRNFIQKVDGATDLIFLTEHYDQGLVLLKRMLKLKTDDVAYLRMKESTQSAEDIPPPTPEEESRLKELLHVDIALYEHFSKRFWHQWKAFGGDEELGPELRALKQKNKDLAVHCAEEPRNWMLCPLEFTVDGGNFNQVLGYIRKAVTDR